jgi:class 3 adenylate cyclase
VFQAEATLRGSIPRMSLPSGTVTFVFTDVEGSTRLLQQLAESYGEVVSAHRKLVREAFAERGGQEIDTQGDAFFYSFPRARDAVAAAVEAQRALAAQHWPDGAVVRVRMGLHTGEPSLGDEGYHGIDVVRAARICAAGHGGQILLSEATRALVGGSLPDGVSIEDLGERRLKDLDRPERIYQLTFAGGPVSFPALKTSDEEDLGALIKADVNRQIKEAFVTGRTSKSSLSDTIVSLAELLGLAVVIIVIVLLVKLVF